MMVNVWLRVGVQPATSMFSVPASDAVPDPLSLSATLPGALVGVNWPLLVTSAKLKDPLKA